MKIKIYPDGFHHPGSWRFEIGTYHGRKSVCVNLHCGEIGDEFYKRFHAHDYFGFLPRFIRIGWYVWKLDREARRFYSDKFPEWSSYLRGSECQPLLEFQKPVSAGTPP